MTIQCALSGDHDHSTTGLFVDAWGSGDAESRQCLRQTQPFERQALVRCLFGGFACLPRFPSTNPLSCPPEILPSWFLRFLRRLEPLRLTYGVALTQEKVHFVAHVAVQGAVRGRARARVLGFAQGVG